MLPLLNGVSRWGDNSEQRLFANFLGSLKQAPRNFGIQIIDRKKYSKMLSLLYWLKNQSSVSEAIGNVTEFIANEDCDSAIKMMQNAVNYYKESESSFKMKKYFETGQFEFSVNATNILTENGNPLPQWFLKSFKSGNVSKFCHAVLNRQSLLLYNAVLNRQSLLLYNQVENLEWESSHACSRHIRQVIYSILILHNVDRLPASEQSVEEYN